jgi:hypothetical protein
MHKPEKERSEGYGGVLIFLRLWRKPHFIRLFSQRVPQISHRGGCDSGGGARSNAKSPQERYENLFLSISPEPFFKVIPDLTLPALAFRGIVVIFFSNLILLRNYISRKNTYT